MRNRLFRLAAAFTASAVLLTTAACSRGYNLGYDPKDYISKVGQYTGMTIELMSTDVTDKDITNAINKLFKDQATKEEVLEGTVEWSTDTLITFTGIVDGEPVEEFTAEREECLVGAGVFIDAIEDNLIGHKVGEPFTIDSVIDDDYSNEELAGKDIHFDIVVDAILKTVYPELTDEMAMSQGDPNYYTADQMREYYRTKLKAEKEEEQEDQKRLDTWDRVVENFEVSGYPDGTVEKYIDVMVMNAMNSAETYGVTYENYISYMGCNSDAEYRESCITGAQQAVKEDIVFYYLLKELGINHSKAEAEKYAEENHDDLGYNSAQELIEEFGTDYIIEFLNRMDLWDYLMEHNTYVVEEK